MSKAPSMPLFWDAYIADTTHLTCEEHGAYLMLLGAMWRRDGSVPDCDKDNARILGLSLAKWRKIKIRLSTFLTFENKTITQQKLQKTWIETQEKIAKNKINGAKGGKAKSSKNKDLGKANASQTLDQKGKQNPTIPEPEPEPYSYYHCNDDKSGKKKRDLDLLEKKVRQAANLTNSPAPLLFDISPILELINAGLDLDMKIIPAIKGIAAKSGKTKITTWRYFTKAIQNQIEGQPEQVKIHNPETITDERWRTGILPIVKSKRKWTSAWGPRPGEAGCMAPADLISELTKILSEELK